MMAAGSAGTDVERVEVAVIGGGPGGMAAAECLAEHGVQATLIDEQPRTGGQFLRRPPPGFEVTGWLPGRLYRSGKALLARVDRLPALDRRLGCTVYGMMLPCIQSGEDRFRLWIGTEDGQSLLAVKAVIVATGAYELAVPFPGWTLPGVMGAGAIQTFLKSQQILPGTRFALVGSHPLQLIVADQILKAGGEIAMLAFSQSRKRLLRDLAAGLPLAPANSEKFLAPAAILARLAARRVPIRFRHVIARAEGGEVLEKVVLARLERNEIAEAGAAENVDCDTLGICYGFVASGELLRQAGAAWRWDRDRGGWLAVEDGAMRTDISGLYAAGETTGVDGADAAMIKGRLAALACLQDRGEDPQIRKRIAHEQGRLGRELRFAQFLRRLATPPWEALDAAANRETPICRCEGVTKGDLEDAMDGPTPLGDPNALKLATRAGMGLCQGRLCGPSIAGLLRKASKSPQAPPPPFTARAPARPVRLGSVASLAESPAR